MDLKSVKKFMDACQEAKYITELLPKLPPGMSPRHVKVIDVIWQLKQTGQDIKVSDVSEFLNVTRPSITKLISELEKEGALNKIPDRADKRVVHLELTALGQKYYEFYVEKYQSWLARKFQENEIRSEDLEATADTISQVYRLMNKEKMEERLK